MRTNHHSSRIAILRAQPAAAFEAVRPPQPQHNLFTVAIRAAIVSLSLGIAAAPSAMAEASAQSANTARSYQINAGALSDVLAQFAANAGVQLVFDPATLTGQTSNGLQGSYTVEQGFAQLLQGTNWEVLAQGANAYALLPAQKATAATQNESANTLPEVLIIASAERDATTEGTGLYASNAPSATSTRLPLEWQETPQSLTILTRQRLDDQKLDTVDSAIEASAGVIAFRQDMGSDLGGGLMSRGFSISNYEVDGIPTSTSIKNGASTIIYDRVEVVRGATGLMSGLGSPGATINLMRKRPTAVSQGSVSLDLGSWSRRGGTVDISGPLNASATARGRLVVDARSAHSYVNRHRNKNSTIYGIIEADLTDTTLLTAGFNQQRNDNTEPLRTGFPLYYSDGSRLVLPRSYNSSPNWTYYDSKTQNAFFALEQWLANGWRGKLEFNHRREDYDGILSYLAGDIDPVTGSGGQIQAAKWIGSPRENSVDGYVTGHFPLLGRQHELVAGFTLSRLRHRNAPSYGWFQSIWTGYDGSIGNIHTWDGSVTPPNFSISSYGDTKTIQDAVYATSRFSLTDSANLIVGARYTNWENTIKTTPLSGPSSQTQQKEKGVVTPYVGLVYQLNDTWSAYGSYTKIFSPQSYGTRDINGNQLDPEEGKSIEAGVKANLLDSRLQASAAVFQTKLDNTAIRDESIQETLIFIPQKGLTSRGFEVELAGEPIVGWNLSTSYAFTSTEDANGNRATTQIPRNNFKLFTTYRLTALPSLTLGGGMNWQSGTGYPGTQLHGSYALMSLLARYEINRNLTASLNISNLLDRKYYTGTASHALYGVPRNVVATLKYNF